MFNIIIPLLCNIYEYCMSVKRYKKSYAIWCNDCDTVFDTLQVAGEHAEQTGHTIKVIEFVTERK